jgi:ubiquinone biosynthesis monooxygenase Coq6
MMGSTTVLYRVTRAALSHGRMRRRILPQEIRRAQRSFIAPKSLSTMTTSSPPHTLPNTAAVQEYDIVIVGGGVIGSVMADQILRIPKPYALRLALVEAGPGPFDDSVVPHPRSYALSPASVQLLFGGAVPDERYFPSGYYTSMQVWEAHQPASIVWTTQDLGPGAAQYLGWCMEDHLLQEYLWKERLQVDSAVDRLTMYPSTELTDIQWPGATTNTSVDWVHGTLSSRDDASIRQPIRTRLVIAADGSRSSVRASAGIAMQKYDYQQTAVTFTVEYASDVPPHLRHRAFQRFLGHGGPMALLPTRSSRHGVVVWSALPDEAKYWMERMKAKPCNDDSAQNDLVEHLNSIFQTGPERLPLLFHQDPHDSDGILSQALRGIEHILGTVQYGAAMAGQQQANHSFVAPPRVAHIASPLYAFPLTCQVSEQSQYTQGTHLALIGDAAHVVHPMAGQGLNLGLLDVQALTLCLEKAIGSGMDVGTFLHEYNTSRQVQVSSTVAGIHGLQVLFSKALQSPISKHIKSLGMNSIQNLPWIRQKIAQAACYGVV